ncbi:hypothetical protein IT568_06705 [bacterium]|nr:hypothetical protein [bacterium]
MLKYFLACVFFSFNSCSLSGKNLKPFAQIKSEKIDECSGIIQSKQFKDVFWVHNDSGDKARIFAINGKGNLLGEVEISNAKNIDWEDVTIDDQNNLVLADLGNNENNRKDLKIYFVKEPNILENEKITANAFKTISVSYEDQKDFPPQKKLFDCEAIFFAEGNIYVLTKHRKDPNTKLYKLPNLTETEQTLKLLEEFKTDSKVTAADYQNGELVVLCYEYLYLFRTSKNKFLTNDFDKLTIEMKQSEAVCFYGDKILVTNEQGEIFLLTKQEIKSSGYLLPKLPETKIKSFERDFGPDFSFASLKSFDLKPKNKIDFKVAKFKNGLGFYFKFPIELWEKTKNEFACLMVSSNGKNPVHLEKEQSVWSFEKQENKVQQVFSEFQVQKKFLSEAGIDFFEVKFFLENESLSGIENTKEILLNVLVFCETEEFFWSVGSETFTFENPFTWGKCEIQ